MKMVTWVTWEPQDRCGPPRPKDGPVVGRESLPGTGGPGCPIQLTPEQRKDSARKMLARVVRMASLQKGYLS